jgi:hypothetical protein
MLSDKTRKALEDITNVVVKGVDVTADVVDAITPFVPGAGVVPVDTLRGIVTTVLQQIPNWYEQGAAALGLDEHITIEVKTQGTVVTGTIHR